jgi:hypothetical protein
MADLTHYAKLRSRMKEEGFPGDDPLSVRVDRAHLEMPVLVNLKLATQLNGPSQLQFPLVSWAFRRTS